MFYRQNIKNCFNSVINANGLHEDFLNPLASQLAKKLEDLKDLYQKGTLPFLTLPSKKEDIKALEPIADHFRNNFSDVIILGTGGSSLGGQALCALRSTLAPRLHFLDNIDPHTFEQLSQSLDLKTTGFIVISKSGGTMETLMQFLTCLSFFETKNLDHLISTHFCIITENKASSLKNLAVRFSIPCLDHDSNLGGRYSALSLVGLLPAIVVGLDASCVRNGAQSVLDKLLNAKAIEDIPAVVGAAMMVEFSRKNKSINVLMPYMDRFNIFSRWWGQLWAESLGKKGLGITPINALGTVDQHSQLQLYLDGPRDKVFTLITTDYRHQGDAILHRLVTGSDIAYFAEKSLGDLMFGEQQATLKTLTNNGCPVREIRVDSINEESMGALMMHFMLETVFAAHLLEVNPFNQDAVEEGKILARQYLQEV